MSVRATDRGHCVICGSVDVEHNHVGGRNHVAWFTMPFCKAHHSQFHALLRTAEIVLEHTADTVQRHLRALKAIKICEWVLLQALEKQNPEEKQ